MCRKCIDRDLESKTQIQYFLKKAFLEDIKILYKKYSIQKKLFQKITKLVFSTLHHDLYICGTCCNYVLCSLDPEESIANNYSITQPIKTILTQEKHIFSVLSKSNVDEAEIPVEISTFFDQFCDFKTVRRSQKWSKLVGESFLRCPRHSSIQRTLNQDRRLRRKCSRSDRM